ncbi:MAG: hypothetical protein Q4C29_02630 [bacterium]|nr:hypothetical protein [bacterium]
MINYKLLKEHGLSPKTLTKNKGSVILETTDNQKYVLKEKNKTLESKFDYLLSRGFDYFPSYKSFDNYDIYEYINSKNISDEEKLYDMVDLISLLHTKTTRYKNIDIDDYKQVYEEITEKIDYLTNYYTELNDLIDDEVYMSPAKYLLARNISKIYSALGFCKREIDNWYELIKQNPKQRISLIHNNLELDHILNSDSPYLISWDKAKTDMPLYDFYFLYKKYYNKTDFDILLSNYQKRYPLKEEELKLLFIKISVPKKIEFTSDEFNNTKEVKKLLDYLYKSDKLISPFYKKQKS